MTGPLKRNAPRTPNQTLTPARHTEGYAPPRACNGQCEMSPTLGERVLGCEETNQNKRVATAISRTDLSHSIFTASSASEGR